MEKKNENDKGSEQISKLANFDKPSIWAKFSRLATITGSANLGKGFPDWECPKFFQEALVKHVKILQPIINIVGQVVI